MNIRKVTKLLLVAVVATTLFAGCDNSKDKTVEKKKEVTILNVSYDPTRELYESYNKEFTNYYEKKTGTKVIVQQSHGGSGAQARAVIDGLEADVVTLALGADIDSLNTKAQLLDKNWQSKLENNSTPYTSTIVFLVRKGNTKNIKNWDDLIKPDVKVITPNPKTSGGARWNYLGAYGYALRNNNNDDTKAKEFVKKLYGNVEVLDSGARQATNTFVQNGIGDVLITWENEALLALKEDGKDKFDLVVPAISVLAEPPVAVVDSNVDKKATREVSEAYLKYLYSDKAQEIIAKNYYRPINEDVLKKYEDQFPKLELFTVKDFGGWSEVQKTHFADGGVFDQIYTK